MSNVHCAIITVAPRAIGLFTLLRIRFKFQRRLCDARILNNLSLYVIVM